MAKHYKGITIIFSLLIAITLRAQNPGLLISEILANPNGTDSCKEYIELRAAKNINFSLTPYTVIVCNNGTATQKGWVEGGAVTYAFEINSGSVNQGDVVYVGGSCMNIAGTKIRVKNVKTATGDGGIGTPSAAGVVGNGGSNADGVAVFNLPVASIDSSKVPVDAIFYGSAIGSALVSSGNKGYQLPLNDIYPGGKLQSSSFFGPDPGSDVIVTASGTYNYLSDTWNVPRSWTAGTTTTDGTSSVLLSTVDITPPSAVNLLMQSPTLLKLKFNEPILASSAGVISNYTLSPVLGINTASLTGTNDTVLLNLSSPLTVSQVYTLSVTGIKDMAANTMSVTQTFTVMNRGVVFTTYTWKHPFAIGNSQGQSIMNGGFSGLQYISGTNNEFYAITDRGPNLDANNNNHAISMGGSNNSAKLFPLPGFNPNVMRMKCQGDSLVFVSSFGVKRPDNTNATGLINPPQTGGTGEIALIDTNGTTGTPDIWGIDSEGLANGNNNDYWVSEEYGVSIWHVDNTGKVINRYAPWGGTANAQPQDIGIDTIFKFRNPNKGFEGIAFTPNEKVYGFLQNTLLFPASDVNLKKNTRLHRFVEIDTRTNATRMLGYEHDAVPSGGALSTIKNDKRYIGDAIAVNDHEILVLEHGKGSSEAYAKVYLVDLTPATPINPNNQLAYAGGTKSFEQLLDSTTAAANGVTVVKKTLLLDLISNGYDPTIEKAEGLAIVNDTCIAIANDNDFGIVSNNSDGVMSPNNVKSTIWVFSFPRSKKLNICNNVTIAASTLTICQGDSALLNTASVSGITYQWKNNNVSVSGGTTSALYARTPGTYELFATNANGCTAISNAKTISVIPSPTVAITPSGTVSVCQGNQVVLNASATTGASYQWYNGSGIISGATTSTYTATVAGSYMVKITASTGCVNTSQSSALTVNPLPAQPVISLSSDTLHTGTAASAYQWYLNGNPIGGATTNSYKTNYVNGNYTVKITDPNGCQNTSAPYNINTTGITAGLTGIESMDVYPNPFSDEIKLDINSSVRQNMHLSLYNSIGQKLDLSYDLNLYPGQNQGTFTTAQLHLPSGLYILEIRIGESIKRIRMMK